MGKFYGGGTVFPELPPASPATVPIIRQSLLATPNAFPVQGAEPAAPAGFAPYMIRPEVQGALPQKQIVPPLWNEPTALSLVGRGVFSQPINMTPSGIVGARPLEAPSPVIPFFTTRAVNAARAANTADLRASITAQRSFEAQHRADMLAHAAHKAITRASVDPDPATHGDARSRIEAADKAQREADRLAQRNALHDQEAAEAAAKAQAAADQEAAAQAARDAANAEANARADEKALLDQRGWPSNFDPGLVTSASPPGYAVPVGGGVLGGFLLAGPVGAIIGALLGGGYVYVKRRKSPPMMMPSPTGHAITGGLLDVKLPSAPISWEFSPYQESDGTWINSQKDQDAWMAAHVPPGGWQFDSRYLTSR
jgi:hypothetical protein